MWDYYFDVTSHHINAWVGAYFHKVTVVPSDKTIRLRKFEQQFIIHHVFVQTEVILTPS